MWAEEVLIPIIAIIGFFSSIIIWVYLFFSTRSRIRMALIEQGKDASIFNKNQQGDISNMLKYGITAILVGLGLVFGYFLENVGLPDFVAYTSAVLVFGGSGLVAYYSYMRDKVRIPEEMV